MIWTPHHVLVAIDGSEASKNAARVGVNLAEHRGGRVTLVTVVRPPEGWWGVGGAPPSPEAMSVAITRARTEVLDPMAEEFADADCSVDLVEEIGDPAGVVLQLAETLDVDVLVVGRRGSSLVERLMLGSVADRLAHEAPCPVLIVP
jgi:nucleotide-binding universal stress UspA family protein